MSHDRFRVLITVEAKEMLRRIGKKYGKRTYETLRELVCDLEFEPDRKGQPLSGILSGLHSLHYSRFRVIYRIESNQAKVLVITAGYHRSGARDDVYEVLEQMVRSGRIVIQKPDSEEGS